VTAVCSAHTAQLPVHPFNKTALAAANVVLAALIETDRALQKRNGNR